MKTKVSYFKINSSSKIKSTWFLYSFFSRSCNSLNINNFWVYDFQVYDFEVNPYLRIIHLSDDLIYWCYKWYVYIDMTNIQIQIKIIIKFINKNKIKIINKIKIAIQIKMIIKFFRLSVLINKLMILK